MDPEEVKLLGGETEEKGEERNMTKRRLEILEKGALKCKQYAMPPRPGKCPLHVY